MTIPRIIPVGILAASGAGGGSSIPLSDLYTGDTVNMYEYNPATDSYQNVKFVKLQNTYVGANTTYNVCSLIRQHCIFQKDSETISSASTGDLGAVDPASFTGFEEYYPNVKNIMETVSVGWYSNSSHTMAAVSTKVFLASVTEFGTYSNRDIGGASISGLGQTASDAGSNNWLRTGYYSSSRSYRYYVNTSASTSSTRSTTTYYYMRPMFCLPQNTPVVANTDPNIAADYVLA